jgi:hypothetical protein
MPLKIADLIAYSTLNDMEFKIEGTIQISLVPIKKQNQLLKKIVIKRHHFISSKTNV